MVSKYYFYKINLSVLLIASQSLQGQRSFTGWPFLWPSVIANPNDVLKKTRLDLERYCCRVPVHFREL